MAGDKAAKPKPAAKTETPAKAPKESVAKSETPAAADSPKAEAKAEPKTEAVEKPSEKPANYSRGEGQKPVTQAYKDNWDAIFGKKKKR